MDKSKGFVAKPGPKETPNFCGKCHSYADFMKKFNPSLRVDQQKEYLTSVHGRLLEAGDQKVATCTSCHGAHGIRSVKDSESLVYPLNVADTCAKCHANSDYMKGYNIPNDQYEKYKMSVHARALYDRQDLSAPTCNSCHGNHGAAPPGLASVANVCGQCHVRQSTLFQASVHKTVFDAMQVGECKQCHSNHNILSPSDAMIGTAQGSVCIACHAEGDGGYIAAQKIRSLFDELSTNMNSALDVLGKAERAGMEVSRPKFELTEAKDSLTNARVLIHSFASDEVEKVINPGLEISEKSQKAGEAALADLSFRRKGLGVSLFFIVFVAVLIYIKVRQIEARQGRANSGTR
jgi:predicted CXXCH cytochrome family protein